MSAAAAADAADSWLDVAGARLRYRDSGTGPALVLVHGWTLDLDMWDPQAAAFGASLRVLRHDRRGFGLSSGDPSLLRDVDDLAALCGALSLDQPVILGMSQGARVAVAYALSRPDAIGGLVLDGAPDLLSGERLEASSPAAQMRSRGLGLAAMKQEWRRHPLMQLHGGDAGSAALLARIIARYPGHDLLPAAEAQALPAPDAGRLAGLAVPALLINGALDEPIRLEAARHLQALLPDARRVQIEGAGHLANLDRPDVYNRHCLDFVTACQRGAAAGPRRH